MSGPTIAIPGRARSDEAKPESAAPLSSGSVVAGRFRLEKLLGEGGMGAVWSARHMVTRRAVAIKFLKEPASLDLVQRFVREAQAANAVQHPNVVEVHDFFSLDSGMPAMVMDLFEGETLASRLEQRGALPLAELARIMIKVVSALSAIHAAGIVHRDLKPENVFLAQLTDGAVEPMVLDFGICKLEAQGLSLSDSDVSTTAGRIIGTPCYMAPEQVRGSASLDARADVWSLGIILYECLTGVRPFDGDSMPLVVARIMTTPVPPIEQHAPHVPAQLAIAIHRMLQREPGERPSELSEVLAALNAVVGEPAIDEAPMAVARPELTRIRQRAERDAETVPRAHLTTTSTGSVSTNIVIAPKRRRRSSAYFGLVFAGAAALGSLVALSRSSVATQPQVAPTSIPAQASAALALPTGSVSTTVSTAVSTAPTSAPPKLSSQTTSTLTAQPRRPVRPYKPVTNFGGRR